MATATDKAALWTALVEAHRASFGEIIAIADAHPRNPILRDLGKRARGGLAVLERENAKPAFSSQPNGYGSLGDWGVNGHGPKIEAMLRSARFHADRAVELGLAA